MIPFPTSSRVPRRLLTSINKTSGRHGAAVVNKSWEYPTGLAGCYLRPGAMRRNVAGEGLFWLASPPASSILGDAHRYDRRLVVYLLKAAASSVLLHG